MSNFELSQYLFKRVNITLKSGESYTGLVVGHWSAEENDGRESIGISASRYSHDGVGIFEDEIKSIKLAH